MNRAVFYDAIRGSLFGGSLSASQVAGIERLLNVWERHYAHREGFDRRHLAYDLATSFHETAHTMQPITERGPRSYFDKYEPGTRLGRVLGNTQPGDGYRFRGEGDVQNTGRRNARRATERLHALGLLAPDLDLERNPALRGDPIVSAHSLFLGNQEGWWTGKRLTDYINATTCDYYGARRVVNGLDRAQLIADYAEAFEAALIMAEQAEEPLPPEPTAPLPVEPPAPPPPLDPTASGAAVSKHPRGMSKLPPGTTKGGT